jgi:hypothetical protein
LQFIPVIGSRELEGKAAKGGIGFGVTSEIYLLVGYFVNDITEVEDW